ncbi:MAG: TetR/AcrR family transcriptional regulator [Candidatus Cloacimonadota bacterium]|nr:TetR/AcrR family transcriptional regulator [Candidatus Cloacimonadota bacterium]
MVRIIKKYEERKKEIVDTAQSLFYQKGYEKTSVNFIIETIGISKGTFYYYFKSKEDLLDSIVEEFTKEIISKLEPVVNNNSLDAITKLNEFYRQAGMYKAENISLIKTLINTLYNDKNLLLRYKMNKRAVETTLPLLSKIFEQGKNEGSFDIEYPVETARIILLFGTSMGEYNAKLMMSLDENPDNINEFQRHLNLYQMSVQRILGAPEGSIKIFDEQIIDAIMEKYNETYMSRKQVGTHPSGRRA